MIIQSVQDWFETPFGKLSLFVFMLNPNTLQIEIAMLKKGEVIILYSRGIKLCLNIEK